jgi:outer membrane protein TolC
MLLSVETRAQETTVMSLSEIVAYGLEHNNDLRAVRYSADEARAAGNETRGSLLPSIRGSGNYTRLSSNIPDFELTLPPEFGGGDFSVPAIRDRYDFTVSVEQPIFTGFQLINQKKASSLNTKAREQDVRSAEAETAYAIRSAYWNLYQIEEGVAVAQAAVRSVEKQLANTIRRREEGAALGSDVLSIQARLGEVKLAALDAENALRIARLQLINVAGFPVDQQLQTTEPLPIDWAPVEASILEQEALSNNPSLQGRTLDYEVAQSYVKAATAGWFPQIFFVGLYQYARPNAYIFPQEDKFTGTWQVGLSAKWDLWNWGQTNARTSQARARASQMAERLASETRSTQFAVRAAVMNVEHRRLAVSVAEQNVRHADAAFSAMERRYELGAALTSEVLDAEVANRNARLQQARAVAAYGIARAELLREIGRVQPFNGDQHSE